MSFVLDCSQKVFVAFAKLHKANTNFVMDGRLSAWKKPAPTGQIFIKFDIEIFFPPKIYCENSSLIKI
jgi:hypothetical protein